METKKMIIAGGSGFLGQGIIDSFRDYEIVILSRKEIPGVRNVKYVYWDGKSLGDWTKELEGCDVLINMAGRSVDCRYNKANKKEILESRLNSTKIIGKAIENCSNPPELWINAGSATIFRYAIDRPMDEDTGEYGKGFSVDVCMKWEAAFDEIDTPKTRKVILRIAMVLGKNGGVMPVMNRLVRFGLGGSMGNGKQFISWIHEYDFVNLIHWIIEHPEISGTYNCSAPNPITNQDFMKILRKECKMPLGIPASKWVLEIGAWMIGTETELILKSRRVVPTKLLKAGFVFKYPEVALAVHELINS